MTVAAILAAVSVVFPPEGAKLPALGRCYVMGAADAGETNVHARVGHPELQASDARIEIAVGRTGAWATVVDVLPGTNVVEVGGVRRTFHVAGPSAAGKAGGAPRTYGKLEYASDVAKPHPKGKRPGEITIVLDAGHGGRDSGALSPHGLPEKDANLRLAKAVRDELVRRGYKVVMTREDDVFVELYDRPKAAHRAKADAFVSIHYNAPGYATNPLAVRALSAYAWNPLGETLAQAVNARMAAADPALANEGVRHANFAVTRNPEIPSCLVEVDYITHPDGEVAAWDASRRPAVAAAIAGGIADWVAGK